MPGAGEGLLTGSVDIYLVASSAMPDEEAMSIVKVIEDNWDMLQTQFAALKRGHPSQFVGNNHTVPFILVLLSTILKKIVGIMTLK